MNLRSSLKAMAIGLVLCTIALGYLWLHSRNIGLVEREMDLEKVMRVLADEVVALEIEVTRLAGFVRAESLWVMQGRSTGEGFGGSVVGRR